MWQKTPLRLGTSLFMRSKKFLPKNSDLKAEFDFIEQSLVKNSTNIPIIPYNDRAFEYLSNILTAKKDAWIDSRVFEGLTTREITDPKEQEIEPSIIVERFFASAPPEARKLAIYCSVLPLNQKVIEEVVKVKALGDDMDAFAEFYFGGLLDRASKDKGFEFEFHKGVRSELIGLISMDEVVSLFEILDGVIADSFGVNQTMLDLLYGGSEDEILSDREREFARLLVEVLGEKGVFFEGKMDMLNRKIANQKNYNKTGETMMKKKIFTTNEEKLDFIIDYLKLTNEEIAKKFGVDAVLKISKIRKDLKLFHLYAFEKIYDIPYKIFEDKSINTEEQIIKILDKKKIVKDNIFGKNQEILEKLEGKWYAYLYPSNPVYDIYEIETEIYDDYSVVDENNNNGYLKIGKNESIIIKEAYNSKNLIIIRFSNRHISFGIFYFVLVSTQNLINEDMVNFGFYSRNKHSLEEAWKILGDKEKVQLKLDLKFKERIVDEYLNRNSNSDDAEV
jgi:hypothetical protein